MQYLNGEAASKNKYRKCKFGLRDVLIISVGVVVGVLTGVVDDGVVSSVKHNVGILPIQH